MKKENVRLTRLLIGIFSIMTASLIIAMSSHTFWLTLAGIIILAYYASQGLQRIVEQ